MNFFLFIFIFLCCFINFAFATCPNETVAYFNDNSLCFSFQSNQTYFLDAEGVCIGLGGHLASVDSMFENVFLSQKALIKFTDSAVTDFWFGATNLLKPPTWTWIDGSSMNFTDWDVKQPQNISEAGCGSIIMQGGEWVANDCYKPKPFVCLIKDVSVATTTLKPKTTRATTTSSKPKSCESSWTYGELMGYCYKVLHNESWINGEEICKMDGAHLASIHSMEEDLFISKLVPIVNYTAQDGFINANAYIGGYTEDNNGHWKWTDGTPFDFQNWFTGEPNDSGIENCLELYTNTPDIYGTWNNRACSWILANFVCKKLPSYNKVYYKL